MEFRWLIVADDVTGAADCAIAFARQGIESAVGWNHRGENTVGRHPVFAYNANSRGLSPCDAGARHREILGRFLDRVTNLFIKIDSTLRGQPAAEIAVAMEAVRERYGSAFGVFALAFPGTGRTTTDGCVRVGGVPLEQTEVWQRQHSYSNADLVEVLATAGIVGQKVPLSTIRGGPSILRATFADIATRGDVVAVCDAETQEDLDCVANASLPAAEHVFFIGSAGLAHALAAVMPGERSRPIRLPATTNGSLIVIGSLAEASRAAARTLAEAHRVRYISAEPAMLLDGAAATYGAALARDVIDGLDAGDDVLVELRIDGQPDLSIGPRLADSVARMLMPAAPHMGALAATGGETAAALLTGFGVHGIRLVNEIEPGISLGLTLGDISVPVVTKAGAFGDRGTLTRIAERLRFIRRAGELA
jgi:uncharacterized protein YgbK (DUF1537 family)